MFPLVSLTFVRYDQILHQVLRGKGWVILLILRFQSWSLACISLLAHNDKGRFDCWKAFAVCSLLTLDLFL